MAARSAEHIGMQKALSPWVRPVPAIIHRLLHPIRFNPSAFAELLVPLTNGDAERAFDMYSGQFAWAGKTVFATSTSLFTLKNVSAEWRRQLFLVEWLKHFTASGRKLHANFAMHLLHCANHAARPQMSARQEGIILYRLSTFGVAAARNADASMIADYFDIVGKQAARVFHAKAGLHDGKLEKAAGLLAASLAFQGFATLRHTAEALLEEALAEVIMPDGSHISKDATRIFDLILMLMPLEAVLAKSGSKIAQRLTEATTRMRSALTLLGLADGAFTSLITRNVDQVWPQALAIENVPSLQVLSYLGYARINHQGASLVAEFRQSLNIEFAFGLQRLFHTISPRRSAGSGLPAQTAEAKEGTAISMRSGQHHRTCFLSTDGQDLRVEDCFIDDNICHFNIQFQAGIKVSHGHDRNVLTLLTPDRQIWLLSLRGCTIEIDENSGHTSVLVKPVMGSTATRINWAFKRQGKPAKTARRKQDQTPRLLD